LLLNVISFILITYISSKKLILVKINSINKLHLTQYMTLLFYTSNH